MRPASALALLLLAAGCADASDRAGAATGCPVTGHHVVVDTGTRTLSLCSEGRAAERFRVSLGRGGVDKRREGDGRTPLGSYALGPPRRSARFGTFIPIAYPTPEQHGLGFTGRDVGIHGPVRWSSWLGSLSTRVDWTAGCVATGTDEELARIAAFVRRHEPRVVLR